MARKRVVQMRRGLERLRTSVDEWLAPPASSAWVHEPPPPPSEAADEEVVSGDGTAIAGGSPDAAASEVAASEVAAADAPEPGLEPEPAEPEPDPELLKWLPHELESSEPSDQDDQSNPSRWLVDESSPSAAAPPGD